MNIISEYNLKVNNELHSIAQLIVNSTNTVTSAITTLADCREKNELVIKAIETRNELVKFLYAHLTTSQQVTILNENDSNEIVSSMMIIQKATRVKPVGIGENETFVFNPNEN